MFSPVVAESNDVNVLQQHVEADEVSRANTAAVSAAVRPVHLLRVFLFRVLESNFPGDPLSNSTDIGIPTP